MRLSEFAESEKWVALAYLPFKMRQAELLLEFCERRIADRGHPYQSRDLEIARAIREANGNRGSLKNLPTAPRPRTGNERNGLHRWHERRRLGFA